MQEDFRFASLAAEVFRASDSCAAAIGHRLESHKSWGCHIRSQSRAWTRRLTSTVRAWPWYRALLLAGY